MIELLLVFLLFSAILSACETALFSIPKSRLYLYEKGNCSRARWVALLLNSPKNLLITLLMINISLNIGVQNVFAHHFSSENWLYSVLCPLLLTVVFGEILPKSLAICINESIAKFMSPFLLVTRFILTPLRSFFIYLVNILMKLVSLKSKPMIIDEKIFALEKSASLGVISDDESQILKGAASLGQIKVKQIMRLKDEMICQQLDEGIDALIHKFSNLECSKIVVFDEHKPLGIIHQEIFFKHQDSILQTKDLMDYLAAPFYVADSFSTKRVLEMMRSKKVRIALIVDEYSSVIGLVTKEDLIEQIVGQIHDKRDDKKLYTIQKDGSVICSGKLLIKQLEDLMGHKFQKGFERTTIGGVLTEVKGDIPKMGSHIVIESLTFLVLGVDEKRVKSLRVFRG